MSSGRIPSIEGGIQPTIFDAKADILTATAADTPARLAVGTNGQYLQADSTTATGLKWASVSAGGMTLLSTTTLSGTTTTISNISQDYYALYIDIYGVSGGTNGAFNINPNSSSTLVYALASENAAGSATTDPYVDQSIHTRNSWLSANTNNCINLWINNYASTTNYKPFIMNGFYINTVSAKNTINTTGGIQTNSAITSLSFTGIGSVTAGTVKIYGVK